MNDFPLLGSIDIPALASVLNGNSIDYTLERNREGREESLYVTEFAFPYWISLDNEQKFLRLHTYIDTSSEVSVAEYLRLANSLNKQYVFIQFFFDEELGRLAGAYMLPARSGLTQAHFLVLARMFPAIFAEATASRNGDGQFIPAPEGGCQVFTIAEGQ